MEVLDPMKDRERFLRLMRDGSANDKCARPWSVIELKYLFDLSERGKKGLTDLN